MRDENGYACFYFDDAMQKYFTLLFLPEVYETVPLSKQKYVPFGLGKLPDYAVHPDAASILCKLGSVFRQLDRGVNPVIRGGRALPVGYWQYWKQRSAPLPACQAEAGRIPRRAGTELYSGKVCDLPLSRSDGKNADGKNKHGQWQQPSRALQ